MRNAFADVIYDIGKIDQRIVMVVADISPAGSIVKFRQEYPDRFINTGVAEQSMIGVAAGLAARGMRPFCYTIATFALYRPFEMIRVDLCYQNLPVTVIGMGAGLVYSTLGGTHHSIEDIAVAGSIPNMTVLAPCDPLEMRQMTRWCATESDGPVYMRLGKAGEPTLTSQAIEELKIGKIRYIEKGKDIALISYGTSVNIAKNIAEKLRTSNKSVSLISCHTLKPLDNEGIKNILLTHDCVAVIEEHVPNGSLGSKVKAIAWDISAKCKLFTFSLKDEFIHFYGSYEELLNIYGLDQKEIFNEILENY
jgi:transketolase